MTLRRTPAGRSDLRPSRRRALIYLVVTLFLATGGYALGAPEGVDYGVRPAPFGNSDRPGGQFAHSLEPGATAVDAVEIFNFTETPSTFDVYAADLVAASGGGRTAASRDAEIVGAGAWLVPELETVVVPPHGSTQVEFSMEVPMGTAPGEHHAGIMVERHEAPSTANIETRTRIGLPVKLEVLGPIDLAVTVGQLVWSHEGGEGHFDLTVTNTGNVTFATSGSVTMTDGNGEPFATVELTPTGLFLGPGEEIGMEARWADPPLFGQYEAQATVVALVGERLPREFESAPVTIWLIPWAEMFIVIAVLGLLTWLIIANRHRFGDWVHRRREERAIVRDYRKGRHLEGAHSVTEEHQRSASR